MLSRLLPLATGLGTGLLTMCVNISDGTGIVDAS